MAAFERQADETGDVPPAVTQVGTDRLEDAELQLQPHENPRKDMDESVLKFIMTGILERIQSSAGGSLEDLIGTQTDWYDEVKPPFPPVPFSYDPSRSEADSSALKRAKEVKEMLEPSSIVLRKLSECVTRQLEDCINHIATIRSRGTFSSLPDEILSSVLVYAALYPVAENTIYGNREKARSIIKTVKAAIKLSSVCSRFRTLIIHSPNLWNHVCLGMPIEMLTTCFERIGSNGVQVFFDIVDHVRVDEGHKLLISFLEIATSVARIWRRFDHSCFPASPLRHDYQIPGAEMAYLEIMTNKLHAPQLSELVVIYHEEYFAEFYDDTPEEDIIHFQRILHYYSTWNVPALQHMSASNLIPIRFSGCTSLQSLFIGMDYYGDEGQRRLFDVVALAAFLSACPVLRKVYLKFHWVTVLADGQLTDRVNMETVEEVDLYLNKCSASSFGYFMDAVRFPHVTTMNFIVECDEDFDDIDRYPRSIIQAVFSNPDVFPHMKQLFFIMRFSSHNLERIRTICIPIHNLPRLTSLHLSLTEAIVEPLAHDCAIPAHLTSIYVFADRKSQGGKWAIQILDLVWARGSHNSLRILSREARLGERGVTSSREGSYPN